MMTKEQIIARLGISESPVEVQEKMLQDLANSVSTRIFLDISEKLSDADLQELSLLIDAGKDQEVEAYIISKIPNFDEFKVKIENDTIDEIAENSAAIRDQVKSIKASA